MQLKIASITNLTDARFFSAIGAHYLGFNFDVLNENNVSIVQAKEIIQWLHEPIIVGEFGIHQTKEEIEFIAKEMELNEIQIPFNHLQKDDLAFEKFLALDDWSIVNGQWSIVDGTININCCILLPFAFCLLLYKQLPLFILKPSLKHLRIFLSIPPMIFF